MTDSPKRGTSSEEGDSPAAPGARALFAALRAAGQRLQQAALAGDSIGVAGPLCDQLIRAADRIATTPGIGTDPAAHDELAAELEDLERDARGHFRETSTLPERSAHRIAVLKARSRVILTLAQIVEGMPARDESALLLAEIAAIRGGLEAACGGTGPGGHAADPGAEGLLQSLSRSRRRILFLRAEAALAAAGQIRGRERADINEAFEVARRLAAARRDLFDSRQALPEEEAAPIDRLSGLLETEQLRLEDLVIGFCSRAEGPADLAVIDHSVLLLAGELDEVRMANPGRATKLGVTRLRRTLGDAQRWLGRFRAAARELRRRAGAPISIDPHVRRLARVISRFRNWTADRVLALRLDRVFGVRMVRFWDALIFWLIMAVLALIVIDHYIDPELDAAGPGAQPHRGVFWTVWVDTAICVVLLVDFFVRLMLSPERFRHFRRHFITELIPSLPFALIANLQHGQALGFAQSIVVIRIGRFLRPILRVFRILLFMIRAADRLVERNSWFLNRDILFFADPDREETVPTLVSRARDLDSWITRGCARLMGDLDRRSRIEAAEWRTLLVEKLVDGTGERTLVATPSTLHAESHEALEVDDVVRLLRELDDHRVAELLGLEMSKQLAATVRFLRFPFLRRIPVVRFIVGPDGALDPLWTTARLGRVAGDLLARVQLTMQWFADLHGTITGAQFLDRVGLQLMKATARPAKRLFIFGGICALVLLLFWAFRLTTFGPIQEVSGVMVTFIRALLVLGLLATVPLFFGAWLRRIAGQASDFYDRVSEAQFLALTEILKEDEREDHLRQLTQRVLLPELRLTRPSMSLAEEERFDLQVQAAAAQFGSAVGTGSGAGLGDDEWAKLQIVLLFHRDFVDGAYFHRNDTKVANMLLGNLTLENIRTRRLQLDRKQSKRLERLDISRAKGGMTGPYVWFNFITHAVSQKVARLILEYNQHCIPISERQAAAESDTQSASKWVERRRRLSAARKEKVEVQRSETEVRRPTGEGLVYRTTEFNALHFLAEDARRDETVRRRYGDEVLALLREDRVNLVREIFGTFPMHELPRERRVFNPYESYGRWLARGKVFFFPFVAGWIVFKGFRILVRQIVTIIKDVLRPGGRTLQLDRGRANFEVARRKIHRMRRPVVMEALRLRAAFDVQYLGLAWPGRELTADSDHLVAADLRRLQASEREWEEFRELRALRERQLRLLARILILVRGEGATWEAELLRRNPALAGRTGESVRALVTAFACDHGGLWSLASAFEELGELALAPLAAARPRPFARQGARRRRKQTLTLLVDRWWPLLAPMASTDDPAARRRLVDALASGPAERAEKLEWLDREARPDRHPWRQVFDQLLVASDRPWSWTEELIAARTVQTLGMIDLDGYEKLIRKLGRYDEGSSDESSGVAGSRRPALPREVALF